MKMCNKSNLEVVAQRIQYDIELQLASLSFLFKLELNDNNSEGNKL